VPAVSLVAHRTERSVRRQSALPRAVRSGDPPAGPTRSASADAGQTGSSFVDDLQHRRGQQRVVIADADPDVAVSTPRPPPAA
jgi:hypothetical protein